jgi:DNA-directed RNA polymerase subunit H (RpoH/RPB5)
MTSASNRILSIYKSRNTILELLSYRGYDISEYTGFSINEIDAMFSNAQLDMLITESLAKDTTGVAAAPSGRKVYVKYFLQSKQIRPPNLDEIIEDLFLIESILTKEDTLVVIVNEEPNDTIINKVKYLYDHDGILVVIHHIKRLQFNILNHQLVPKMTILGDSEKAELYKRYSLQSNKNLPEISRFDPQALAVMLRPGEICRLERKSATALTKDYYRVCI